MARDRSRATMAAEPMTAAPPDDDGARLLDELAAPDEATRTRALDRVYERLREVARGYMGRERRDHTLEPTELVNEACLRLMDRVDLNDATHGRLLGCAARAMRQVLVDHARRGGAEKRGGGWHRVTLRGVADADPTTDVSLASLAAALEWLEKEDPRLAEMTEWHYFAGMTGQQIADQLGISRATVTRELSFARALLLSQIDRLEAERT